MSPELARDDRKANCVVVDTSVWRSEPLLKTPLGVTLVYTLSRQGGLIGLPEVVESELKNQIVESGLEAAGKADSHFSTVRVLTDNPFPLPLPCREELEQKVDARLAELSGILVREPFTLQHARAALGMVNARVPPNGPNNQQFKDSAIWQAVLSLAGRFRTHFVTKDKAFFVEKDATNGLAANLRADCRKTGVEIGAYDNLASCLEAISGDEPAFDRARVTALILGTVLPVVTVLATENRFEVRDVLSTVIKAFRTRKPDRLALDYTVTVQIEDDPSVGEQARRVDCRAVVHGSSYYDLGADALEDSLVQRVTLAHKSGSVGRSFREYDSAFEFPRPIPWE